MNEQVTTGVSIQLSIYFLTVLYTNYKNNNALYKQESTGIEKVKYQYPDVKSYVHQANELHRRRGIMKPRRRRRRLLSPFLKKLGKVFQLDGVRAYSCKCELVFVVRCLGGLHWINRYCLLFQISCIASALLIPASRTSWLQQQKHTSTRIHPFIGSTIRIMPSLSCSEPDDEEKDEEDREMDTSETLAWRFMMKVMAALDLGRPIPPEEEIDIRLKIMCARQKGVYLNKCRADPSTRPNAGWGVFAIQDIEPDELITLYPVDAVIYRKAGQSADTILLSPDISDHDSFAAFVNDSQAHMDYALLLDGGLRAIPDPARRTDPVYLGHLINDYCAILCADFQPLTDEEKEECLTNYDSSSRQNSNCVIKGGGGGCHIEFVATKFISAGSELFLHYGGAYWLRELGLAGLL
jgi:hypothetical protein